MTKIINGKKIAQSLRNNLKNEIVKLKNAYGKGPGLAVVQVGNVAASSVYVKAKSKSALEIGIEVIDHHLEESITQDELLVIELGRPDDYYRLCIPKGLWYGFTCLSRIPAVVANCADRLHDPDDAEMICEDDSSIPYCW